MRTSILIGVLLSLFCASILFAGQIPSHIQTGDLIRQANPNIEKIIAAAPEAYLAGSNGPDISNIMHYLTTPSIGDESHYEKTGDLTIAIMEQADTDEEKAFALGWMTHWVNDYFIHALVNQWGGWFESDEHRHKALEMLENKYVYSAKSIRKYQPDTIPAPMGNDTYDAVYQAFKKTYPNKSKYTSSDSRTNFLLWFRQANGHIRSASKSFMEAADNGSGIATDWITWAVFPHMPTEDQYQNIMKFAKITEVSPEKGKLTIKADVYDTKLHKWFLKQWDESQASAAQYSKQVCDLAARFFVADAAQRDVLRPQLSAVLPNVSIDQPRGDFENSKIYPGNVNAKEVYYECTITDTASGSGKLTVVKGTQPIKIAASTGFDGAAYGDIKLDIPVPYDTYKYDLKVSFKDKDVLSDADLKDYAWLGAEGSYGTSVAIEGDKSCKAGSGLKLKAVVQADPKTKPLVKLRWKNETTKSALGPGDTISFKSTQMGKFTVKVEAWGTVNQKDVVFADAEVEIEVTEPEVQLDINGDSTVEPGKPLPLEASINADSSIVKSLEVRWTDDTGKTSYGKGNKIDFTSQKKGSLIVKAEAFWKPDAKSSPISVGRDTISVTVGTDGVNLRVDGASSGKPSAAIPLKAVLDGVPTTDMASVEFIWSDSDNKEIARGASTSFKADQAGTYVIAVEAVSTSGGKKSSLCKTTHTIQIGAAATTVGALTASIAGLPDDAIVGGTVVFGADEFRSGGKPYVLVDNADAGGVLAAKWSDYWQSTHKAECDAAVKQGKSAESIVPTRPNGWGVESIKVVWKSDPTLSITPADTINNAKTSAKLTAPGKYTVWAELYLKTANGLQAAKAGETEKRLLTVSPPTLNVELKPSKTTLRPGEIAEVKVVISGGKAPYKYTWTGNHAGDGAVVSTVSRKIGPLPLSVSVTDADDKAGSASVTLRVAGVKAKLAGIESKVIYGMKSKLGNQIEGDDQPVKDSGICDHCGEKLGSNKKCLYCVLAAHDVTQDTSADGTPFADKPIDPSAIKSVSTAPDRNDPPPPPPVVSSSGTKPSQTTKKPDDKQPKRMIIWQSEPALTFSPPKSADGKTTVLYDRVGKVKIWTEILEMKDGVYQTVGETDQVEIDVAPPAFAISFSPESAKAGQEVKATVKTSPVISDKLLNYVWFSPESSNRMEYEKNASVIGFKLKDAKPVELNVEARVPFFGDTLAEGITATFTGSQYLMTTIVTGTKPQIWKEGVGLVDVERAYAVDQNVRIRAEFVDEKPTGDVRYQWTVNEGTSMGSSGLGNEVTVSRHEVGTIEAKVETRDPDGAPLGRATAVVSITVSADDVKKAKDKGGSMTVALTAPKSSMVLGESLKLSAAVKGGVAPYKYTWSAGCKPAGATAVYAAKTDGKQNITVTAKDSKGKTATATLAVTVTPSGLNVQLTAGKASLMVNESTSVKAVISGGKAPYTLTWSPNIEGTGNEVRMTGADPGPATVTLKVVDAQKKSVTKQVAFQVSTLVPTLQGIPEQAALGTQVVASITYPQSPPGSKINAKPLPTIYWHCEPQVNMSTRQSDGPGNLITFDTLGSVKIWGEIISRRGKMIGKTEIKTCTVVAPVFTMKFTQMAQGFVTASVAVDPESVGPALEYKWMRPSGGVPASSSYAFKPGDSDSVDIYLVVRHKSSGQMVKEIREVYTNTASKDKPASGNASNTKDKPSVSVQPKPKPDAPSGALSEAEATARISQARTLAANGKIEEAVELVRSVEKVVPEKSSVAIKAIAKDAANWGMTVISNDLDFPRATQLLALAVHLDSGNTDAAAKQKTVAKWANNWEAAQVFVDQFNKSLADGKIVTADAQNKEARSRIEGIPGTKPTALINDMSSRYAKARDQYILKLQPKRLLVMDYMKGKSFGQARTVIDEVLTLRVVPELTASHKQEFEGWLDTCNKQTKTAQAASTTKPADSSKPQSTKKKGSSLDDIIGALDKIGAAIDTISGKKPVPAPAPAPAPAPKPTASSGATSTPASATSSKPTLVVSIGNSAACQFTDTATFRLDKPVNVTQLIMWYSWSPGETSVPYKLYRGVQELRSSRFVKGGTDTYQKQWGDGVDEPQMNLQAGEYVVKVANKRMAQNSGTGGNGMIRVVTGGYLVPPSSGIAQQPASTTPKPAPADTPQPTAPVSSATAAQKPVAPQTMTSLPSGWVTRSAGDVTVSMPGNWAAIKSMGSDEGAWYQGDMNVPDIGFGIVRGGKTEDALDNIQLQSQADITVGGLSARSYIGKSKGSDLTGWLIAMKAPRPDGRMLFFVGVSKPATWSTYKPTLEKVVGTIKIGSTSSNKAAPVAKPAAAPVTKTVVATMSNKASQNVHIFVDGDTFGEHNRLTPGQTRTLSIKMPANGRIKFTAGRSGTVITTKIWDGDPDDTNRVPKVIFDSSEKLVITTGLR